MIKLYLQKWRWYQRNSLPWNRLAIHREFMKRGVRVVLGTDSLVARISPDWERSRWLGQMQR